MENEEVVQEETVQEMQEVQAVEPKPEDTQLVNNAELEQYQRLIENQAKQIESLTNSINMLVKSGAQINTVANRTEQPTNTMNPLISSYTADRFADVKPLDELDYKF